MAKISLRVGYSHHEPIALKDLTGSLNSFAAEYRIAQKRVATKFEDDKTELYVTKIREGSIIAELTPYVTPGVAAGMALIENANAVGDFCNHLKTGFDFFLGHIRTWKTGDKKSAENIAKIVAPVAREIGSQINFSGSAPIEGNIFNITINHGGAKEVQRKAKSYIQELDAPGTKSFESVRLHWYQARNDLLSRAGDKAIASDLSEKPVKVLFSTDAIKTRMLNEEKNPFLMYYIVDVTVDFKGRNPKLYLITKVHAAEHR